MKNIPIKIGFFLILVLISKPCFSSSQDASEKISQNILNAQAESAMDSMNMGSDGAMDSLMTEGGRLGAYPMSRDASGTSWQPDSEAHQGLHRQWDGWTLMLHGYATAIYDDQGGRRGASENIVASHFMGVAEHAIGQDKFTFHGAISLDPLMGKRGFPLLLQTGETADGKVALIDRQHPHNFFSELSGIYTHPLGPDAAVFSYLGYPGEPALGPVTYLHRFAGLANPETPISHHWLDSTHVTFGVATIGVTKGTWKLEISDFTGREPDQYRWGFNPARFDSWSTRLTFNPAANWSMQVSHGYIHSPEQLTPEVNQKRSTASITYNRPIHNGVWETTLAWGLNQNSPGHDLNAYLLESAWQFNNNAIFGRLESLDKDELFTSPNPLQEQVFHVSKLSLGYFKTLELSPNLALDLGGLVSKYQMPALLHVSYGSDPTSVMLFARVKLR